MSLLWPLLELHTSVQRVQLLLLLHLVLLLPSLLPPSLLPPSNILDLSTWKQDWLIIPMEPRFLLMNLLLLLLVPHTSVQRLQLLLLLQSVLLHPLLLPPLLLHPSNILDLSTWKQDLLIILMEPRFLLMSLLLLLLELHTSIQRLQLLLLLQLVLLLPLHLPHSNILDLSTWKQDLLTILMELRFLLMSLLLLLLVQHTSAQRMQLSFLLPQELFQATNLLELSTWTLG